MEKEISEISDEEEKELNDKMDNLQKRLSSKSKKLDLEAIEEVIDLGADFDYTTQTKLISILCNLLGLFTFNSKGYALLTEKILIDTLLKRNLSNKELLQLISLRIRNYKVLFR